MTNKENFLQLSVVVPVHNESGNIVPLIEEIHKALEGIVSFEVVYVDDGSQDATPKELDQAKAKYPKLTVVRHKRAFGQSVATVTGVKQAQGEWIVTLDGDGQNDPADIPKLWEKMQGRKNVLLIGRRQKRDDSAWRLISSKIANTVRSSMLGDATPDSGCGLKMMARGLFLSLPHFNHMHRFTPALVIRQGGVVESVPINHRPRTKGQSKYGTLDRLMVGIVDLFGVMWLKSRAATPEIERVVG